MTGREVYALLYDLRDYIDPVAYGDIIIDDDLKVGAGSTADLPNWDGREWYNWTTHRIGAAGLKDSDKPLSSYKAMLPIMAFFHEVCGHGGQLKYEFNEDTELSRILALSHHPCMSSDRYYMGLFPELFSKQYASHPHEIAAQYMAFVCAQEYLPRIWGKEKTDEMLLSYVNGRGIRGSEFVHKFMGYRKMGDVFNDFQAAFSKSVTAKRTYKYVSDFDFDSVAYCVHEKQLDESQAKMIADCNSGLHQDMMLTTALCLEFDLKREPYVWPPVMTGLRDVLYVEDVFAATPPWTPDSFRPSFQLKLQSMIQERDALDAKQNIGPKGFGE